MFHIEQYLKFAGIESAASGIGLGDEQVETLRNLYREGFGRDSDLGWNCDKANMNLERIGLIRRLFPESRIVWVVRHPLDTILSCYCQDFQHGLSFTNSLYHLARMYIGHWRLMLHWIEHFGDAIQIVKYDQLVRTPEEEVRALCSWLGLDYQASMIEPHLQTKPVRTASSMQVQEPINTRSLNRWRHYATHLVTVAALLREAGIIDDKNSHVWPGTPGQGH